MPRSTRTVERFSAGEECVLDAGDPTDGHHPLVLMLENMAVEDLHACPHTHESVFSGHMLIIIKGAEPACP